VLIRVTVWWRIGKKHIFFSFQTKKLALFKGRVTRYTTFGSNKPTAANEANRSNLQNLISVRKLRSD